MTASHSLSVSYAQIAVFQASEALPFSYWTAAHVNQGFAWRPGAVSFRTKAEDGPHRIEVACQPSREASADGLRVIEVPFAVLGSDRVVIASIGDEFQIKIPEGSYALRFVIAEDDPRRILLSFLKADHPGFSIVRADSDLTPGAPLVTDAEPA